MTIFFELKLSDNYENPGKLFKDEKMTDMVGKMN